MAESASPSRRTLVRLIEVLQAQAVSPSEFEAALNFHDWLYEHDFQDWFVIHAQSYYDFDWRRIIVDLKNGQFFFPQNSWFGSSSILGGYLSKEAAIAHGEALLERLAALSPTLKNVDDLKRSPELDGLEPDTKNLKLHDLAGSFSASEEQSRTDSLTSQLEAPEIAKKHSESATRLFIEGDFHPSLNESRNFVQEVIDQISVATDKHGGHSTGLPGGMANRIEYLRKVGFLSADEENGFRAAWGMLSAGSHPGIPAQEEARIGLILALELGQILLN